MASYFQFVVSVALMLSKDQHAYAYPSSTNLDTRRNFSDDRNDGNCFSLKKKLLSNHLIIFPPIFFQTGNMKIGENDEETSNTRKSRT